MGHLTYEKLTRGFNLIIFAEHTAKVLHFNQT